MSMHAPFWTARDYDVMEDGSLFLKGWNTRVLVSKRHLPKLEDALLAGCRSTYTTEDGKKIRGMTQGDLEEAIRDVARGIGDAGPILAVALGFSVLQGCKNFRGRRVNFVFTLEA